MMREHKYPLLIITLGYWLLTLPFLSHYPFNWDAAQFTLGVTHYDIGMHQPHPPGYPWYVWLGKLLATVLTPHSALLVITTLIGFIATIGLYVLLLRFTKARWLAVAITCVWLLNPLFWLHREVSLTYVVDAAASTLVALFAYQTVTTRQRWNVYAASLVLAIAGGFRPSLLFLLLPLHLFQLWFHKRNWKVLATSAAILLIGTLAWAVPVVIITGGISEYLSLSRNLYGTAAETSSVFAGANPSVILQEIKLVAGTIGASLNVLGLLLLFSAALGIYQLWSKGWRIMLSYQSMLWWVACWILPALFVYCFVHFGQIGYALILMPAAYVGMIPVLMWILNRTQRQRWMFGWGVAVLVAIHASVFLVLSPSYAHPNYIPHTRADVILQRVAQQQTNAFKLNWAIIKESDAKIDQLAKTIQSYPADQTLVVTGRDMLYPSPINGLSIRNDELFRELSAVLTDYQVVEVGPNRGYSLQSKNARMVTVGDRTIKVPATIKYVIFAFDQFPSDVQPQQILTEDHGNYYLGIMSQAWQFAGFTVKRPADEPIKTR